MAQGLVSKNDDVVVEQSRSRRDVRPLRLVEIPENMIGNVLDVSSGRRHEFFAFKQPDLRQLNTTVMMMMMMMMMMIMKSWDITSAPSLLVF